VREFLTKYNLSRLPSSQIARNVLEELGVPTDRTTPTLELIVESAQEVGFLREVKGQTYVDLEGIQLPISSPSTTDEPIAATARVERLEVSPATTMSVASVAPVQT